MNTYYEMPDGSILMDTFARPMFGLAFSAYRVWIRDPCGEVYCLKNRAGSTSTVSPDLTLLHSIKTLYTMKAITPVNNVEMFISFPALGAIYNTTYVENSKRNSMERWLVDNTQVKWAILNSKRVGAYLSNKDATAFRLRWG